MTVSVSTAGKISLGLERIIYFLEHILPEDPRAKLRVVHVAGTNGKGSVCALVSEAAVAAGYKVGIFNSPHFLEPNDAIRIQSQPIPATEYADLRKWIASLDTAAQSPAGLLTPFEVTTVTAIWWFARHDVDLAVIEVGLGGLRDATNVFGLADGQSSPMGVGLSLVQCICPVDEDHLGVIGNTVEEIASEKAGIMRPGSWIVIANQESQDAFHRIWRQAHFNSPERIVNVRRQPCPDTHVLNFSLKHSSDNGDCSATLNSSNIRCPPAMPSWAKVDSCGQRCLQVKYPPSLDTYSKSRFSSPINNPSVAVSSLVVAPTRTELDLPLVLPGYYQAGNASVAFYALDILRTYYGYDKLTDAAIQTGFLNVSWPGRLSWLPLKHTSSPPLQDLSAGDTVSPSVAATTERKPSPSSRSSTSSSGKSSGHSSDRSSTSAKSDGLGMWILADGAHNEAAAIELRKYIDNSLRRFSFDRYVNSHGGRKFRSTPPVRWIVGFSQGKAMTAILQRLVLSGDSLWLVPFSTPSEMPWIHCVDTKDIYNAAQKLPDFENIDVVQFDSLA
ncbi:folylpolyglutamate synthase, partial [Coemansia aciculifera]